MLKPSYIIPKLPLKKDLETKSVLKAAARAHRHLAELKGKAASIPNQGILIETLSLQEAKESSAIESIVTTQDHLFRASLYRDNELRGAEKEVLHYRDALKSGFDALIAADGLLTNNTIIKMFQILKRTEGGFRKQPGTMLSHDVTCLLYTSPSPRD